MDQPVEMSLEVWWGDEGPWELPETCTPLGPGSSLFQLWYSAAATLLK